MTQADVNREVAHLLGESVRTISQRGFSLVTDEPEPLVIDWDDVTRPLVFPVVEPAC